MKMLVILEAVVLIFISACSCFGKTNETKVGFDYYCEHIVYSDDEEDEIEYPTVTVSYPGGSSDFDWPGPYLGINGTAHSDTWVREGELIKVSAVKSSRLTGLTSVVTWIDLVPPDWVKRIVVKRFDGSVAITRRNDCASSLPDVAGTVAYFDRGDFVAIYLGGKWDEEQNQKVGAEIVFLGDEETCNACKSCAEGKGMGHLTTPVMSKVENSSDIELSAQMPVGINCCSDHPIHVVWASISAAAADAIGAIDVNMVDLQNGNAVRVPGDVAQPLEQLKMGDVLGVIYKANSTAPLKWRLYDATGIGARSGGGAGPYPLTKIDSSPLPLLEEVTLTQQSSTSIRIQQAKGGNTVADHTMTFSSSGNFWEDEDIVSFTKDKFSVISSGSGLLATREHREKNLSNNWTLLNSSAEQTKVVSGQDLVIGEYEGGDLVRSMDYYSDGRLKWTLNESGSWQFIEYPSANQRIVYGPYGDTVYPWDSSGDWTPTGGAGIQWDEYNIDGTTHYVEGNPISSVATSVDEDMATNYSQTVISNDGHFERRNTYTTSAALPAAFSNKTLLDDDGRGITTAYLYTRGNMQMETVGGITSNVFHADFDGDCLKQVVSRGASGDAPELDENYDFEASPSPDSIGASFEDSQTREVRITDPKGRVIYSATEVLDGTGYAVATQTVRSYTSLQNNEGEVVTEARDGRVVSISSSFSDGTWAESVDDSGAVRTTVRDLLGKVTTETSPGDGSMITRTHAYDGLTTKTTTAGGGLSLVTYETRDLRGRIASSTEETGIVTSYSYPDGGRTTSMTRPGGVTDITTNYLDGRFKQRSGSGVMREFASYAVDASGNELTKRSSGPAISAGHGARWTETTTDPLGRTISVRHPGPPDGTGGRQADITESYSYDTTTGKLASIESSTRPGIYQLMEEDLLGTWSASGIATHTGPLLANSSDRFGSVATTYEKRNGRFWEISTRSTYVQGSTPVITISAGCLWAGDGEASESTDAANVTSTRITAYDPANKTVVMSSGNSLHGTTTTTMINGFMKKRSVPGAPQDETFAYDGLGRGIRQTDVRNASTHTIYNNLGQVEKVVDHLGQTVAYTYYPATHISAGRVHTQTDAAGKVTETEYDPLGRVSSITGNAAYPVAYAYNDFGDRETLTTSGTQTAVTTWVNDPPTGLLLEKKYQDQTTGVKFTYYSDGKLKSRTWRRGIKTDYGYNSFGDLDYITYPDSTPDVLLSNFDRLGRAGTVTEGGNVTTLAYDSLTGETSTTYAAGHGVLSGLSVIRKTPNSGRPGGYTLKQGSTTVEDVAYGYDTFGRFSGIASGANQIGYQYYPGTGILRETTHIVTGGGTPRIETRSVDLAGRLTGIVTTVPNGAGRRVAASAGYMLNERGLREKLTREDGTSWNFGYNDRSEVTSGLKKLANGSLAAGLQFGYQYDGIGNREWAKSGGDSSGLNQSTVNYTRNALNQYSSITTPGSFDVLVRSPNAVGVVVNGTSASVANQGDFYRAQATATNTNGAWVALDITSPPGAAPHVTGHRWLPPASFAPQYDDDGNLLDDGRWTNTWDAENRLLTQTTTALAASAGVPRCKVENTYDWQSRRIQKKVFTSTNGTTWTLSSDERFVYEGWNQLAVFAASGTLSAKQTNLWGLDLSGGVQGAGGVSGLLAVNTVSPQSVCYPAYDGNGNILAWTSTNGDTLQRIDYDPFGNVVSREGISSFDAPPWGFSTKYQDGETGLLYYGFRFYDPVTGRWPSRDPIEERGGLNLYGFIGNDGVNQLDYLGSVAVTEGSAAAKYFSVLNSARMKMVNTPMHAYNKGGMVRAIDVIKTNAMSLRDIYYDAKYLEKIGANAAYIPFKHKIAISEDVGEEDALHEGVHALYSDRTGDALEEGRAYAMEALYSLHINFSADVWDKIQNSNSTLGDNCPELIRYAQGYWRAFTPSLKYDFYKKGYTPVPLSGVRLDESLNWRDFWTIRQDPLNAKFSCKDAAEILNKYSAVSGCCVRFSCESGPAMSLSDIMSKGEKVIYANGVIDSEFK